MRRQVNFKLAACLLAAMVLLGGAVHFLHAFQVRRSAAALLRMAKRADEQGRLDLKLTYLNLYLVHEPHDPNALADLGMLLERRDNSEKTLTLAFEKLELAVGLAPERKDVHRRLVDIGMRIKRFRDAHDHLTVLLESSPKDAELEHLQGDCLAALREFPKARAAYTSAIEHAPAQVKSYVSLAWLLRGPLGEAAVADRLVLANPVAADKLPRKGLLTANAALCQAWLASARYLWAFGTRETDQAVRKQKLEQAAQHAQKARALLSGEKADRRATKAAVLFVSASIAQAGGKIDEARGFLKEGVRQDPQNSNMYKALAEVESQANRPEAAVAALRGGIKALTKAAGKTSDGRHALLWSLAKLLANQGDLQELDRLLPDLKAAKWAPPLLDFLAAWMDVKRERWWRAADALEKVQPLLVLWPDEQRYAHLLLGECYGRLGDFGRQYAAYRAATRLDALSPAAHVGMGGALAAMGKVKEAVEAYRKVAAGRREAGKLLIRQALRQPEKQRSWDRVETYLAGLPESAERTLVQADLLTAQDQLPKAYELLAKATEQHADNVEIWVTLAALAREQKQWDGALKHLDEAERRLAKRPEMLQELRLARAQFWGHRGGPEAPAALAKLVGAAEKLTGEERRRLTREVAESYARLKDIAECKRLYARLAEQYPNDLESRLVLFDLANQADDEAAVTRVTDEIRRIEGKDGALGQYVEATRLIAKARAKTANKQALAEARDLLKVATGRRPFWPRALLSLARLEDASGDVTAAITKYQEAIKLGVQDRQVIERVVELLHAQHRLAEAEAMAQALQQRSPTLGAADRVAIDLAFEKQDYTAALDLATKAKLADSKNYRDHLRLGRLYEAAKQYPEAERALQRAVALASDAPEAWANLILFQTHTGAKQKAVDTLHAAEKKLPVGPAVLALAYCYEVLERTDRAEELYRAALAARPDDVAVLRANALFALRVQQPAKAKTHLQRMLAKGQPSDKEWAKRLQAILHANGDYEEVRAALAELGVGKAGKQESADDLRAKAFLLANQQGPRHWKELVGVLENLARVSTLTEEERYLLARRYEALGEARKAREQMLLLLAEHDTNATYVAYYAERLVQRKEVADARTWLARLEALEPKTFRTLGIKALILKAEGSTAEAVPFLKTFAAEQPKQVLAVAGLLERLGELPAAEELYRKHVAQSEKPEVVLDLAGFLGRRQRTREALDLCEGAWKTCHPLAVTQACIYVFSEAPADKAQAERIERWLQAAVEKEPQVAVQRVGLGLFRTLQKQYAEAEACYRQALEVDGKNAAALNNLAWLLSFQKGKEAEALALVERAINKAGPKPTLLDTRARIHRALGQRDLALKDLDEAIGQTPSGLLYFHRALAHFPQNRPAARTAWREAVRLNLREAQIDPREQADFVRLHDEFRVN